MSIRLVAWILAIGGLAIPLIGTGFAGWPIVLGWAVVLLAVWLLKPLTRANRSRRVILAFASIPLLVLAATLFGLYLIPAAFAWLVAELRSDGQEPPLTTMQHPSLTLRRYGAGDHAAIVELHLIALDAVGANLPGPHDADLDDIDGIYLRRGGDFLVGELDGRIIAMGALRRIHDDEAEVKRMRVHPDFQRRGIGEQVYDRIESRARELGYRRLRLDTTTRQHAALGLYMKKGYQQVGSGIGGGLEILFLAKDL